MNQGDFAEMVIHISPAFWSKVLTGGRNLGPRQARTVARIMDTDVDTWMIDGDAGKRGAAWDAWCRTFNTKYKKIRPSDRERS